MKCIINSYMSTRKLASVQNYNFQEIARDLSALFRQLQSEDYDEKFSFLLQCIEAVHIYEKDKTGQQFLFE